MGDVEEAGELPDCVAGLPSVGTEGRKARVVGKL